MAGHSRPKDGVLSHAYVPAIHVLLAVSYFKDVDARHRAGHDGTTGSAKQLEREAGAAAAGGFRLRVVDLE